jgi:hypothetical protein
MLDKNSFLELLSKAENETTVFMQQTVGKHDLIKKLIEAINTGNYDAKPENAVPHVEENITVDQA